MHCNALYCIIGPRSLFRGSKLTLERHSYEAVYTQIAKKLTRQILEGHYMPGDRLPTERELREEYGVSRVTVREAMDVLLKARLVVRRRAKGTFVAGRPVRHNLATLSGFYQNLVAQGITPQTTLLEFRFGRIDGRIARILGSEEALFLVRRYERDGVPFAINYVYMHPAARTISHAQADVTPTYDMLTKMLGFSIARTDLAIRAQRAGSGPARELGLSPNDPLLVLDRTTYDPGETVLEYTTFFIRPETYEFGLSVSDAVTIADSVRAVRAEDGR